MAPYSQKDYLNWVNKRVSFFAMILLGAILSFYDPSFFDVYGVFESLGLYIIPFVVAAVIFFSWKAVSEQFKHAIASRLLDAGIKDQMQVASGYTTKIGYWINIMALFFLLSFFVGSSALLFLSLGGCSVHPFILIYSPAKLASINR